MPPDASTRLLMSAFSKHYRSVTLAMPDRFARREFGFMFFDRNFVMRHMGFASRAALKKFLVDQAPSHVYHSCAYYERPSAPTMADKKWLGADLIFDLDADHVRGTEGLRYEEMLEKVKSHLKTLVDDFLIGDLGFQDDDLKIVFSGGRGYHVHVTHPSVIKLSSHERREIVDYITGTGLDIDVMFPQGILEISRFKDNIHTVKTRRMVQAADGGWFARIRKGIEVLFEGLESMDGNEQRAELAKMLKESGMKPTDRIIDGLHKDLLHGKAGERGIDRMRNEDNFEVFSDDRYLRAFLGYILAGIAPAIGGETDEPVTSDIKRLIRLPTSLHGKTGFEVVPMKRGELDDFDPFVQAVPEAFGSNEISIRCAEPVEMSLKGVDYSLDEGVNRVPEYVAVHLICRRLASVDG